MANADLARLINSDEIQSVVNAPKEPTHAHVQKKNPLKNLDAMLKLNPYQDHIRRQEQDNAVRDWQPADRLKTPFCSLHADGTGQQPYRQCDTEASTTIHTISAPFLHMTR